LPSLHLVVLERFDKEVSMSLFPTTVPRISDIQPFSAATLMGVGGFNEREGLLPSRERDFAIAAKPRALVVDDAPDVTEMLSLLLQYAGYEVVTVYSGQQALDAALGESFDVIVSDIGMPGMNGYELAERLRASDNHRSTPMIAVTGFSMYDDRDRALACGFNAFITKPVNPRDLIALVERLRG
jgi:CheY-like chemotaxis protein